MGSAHARSLPDEALEAAIRSKAIAMREAATDVEVVVAPPVMGSKAPMLREPAAPPSMEDVWDAIITGDAEQLGTFVSAHGTVVAKMVSARRPPFFVFGHSLVAR